MPTLTSASLTTAGGTPVGHTASTSLNAGHKGVQVVPTAFLSPNTVYVVSISGVYDSAPFSYTWSFKTSP
ncbi:MAG: Ig-like domain-containing protein [Candidatus Roseilinea sp.]|uniref:Ig-like domain-containing protein n=1 Tax=Candidatus Roseilinea sp. TaxID=2838777 RepID=UPI0040499401